MWKAWEMTTAPLSLCASSFSGTVLLDVTSSPPSFSLTLFRADLHPHPSVPQDTSLLCLETRRCRENTVESHEDRSAVSPGNHLQHSNNAWPLRFAMPMDSLSTIGHSQRPRQQYLETYCPNPSFNFEDGANSQIETPGSHDNVSLCVHKLGTQFFRQ